MRAARRFAEHPVLILLPLQTMLLLWRLDRLPAWGDEEMTGRVCAAAGPEALQLLANDIHPPLYFWIARSWLQLPWNADAITALRGLSVLFALLTGVVVYLCWIRHRGRAVRGWFAVLWATSPFLLLYGRMARSYTLQMLLGVLAVAAAERLVRTSPWERGRPARGPLLAYVVSATLLLYTHYLPGIALIASVGAVLLWRLLNERDPALLVPLLAPPALIAAAYAPWVPELIVAAERLAHPTPYALTASPLLDRLITLAYVFVSFTFGETTPVWAAGVAILAAPLLLWLAVAGAAARPAWLAIVAIAAALAFAGASRWVSYAFVSARLSFAYPFWLMILVSGIARRPRLGRAGGAALLAIVLGGLGSYLRLEDFLNKAYVVPVDAIAGRITADSTTADTLVLVDPRGAQLDAGLRRRLPATLPILELWDDTAAAARQHALDSSARTVWVVRSTIDRSPERWVSGLEAALGERFARREHRYVPYSALDRFAMRLAGWREQPTHVIAVIELRR